MNRRWAHSCINLITVLYAIIAVRYDKEDFKVFKKNKPFLCDFQPVDHAGDTLIESYSAQPATEQQFESSSIVSRFIILTFLENKSARIIHIKLLIHLKCIYGQKIKEVDFSTLATECWILPYRRF